MSDQIIIRPIEGDQIIINPRSAQGVQGIQGPVGANGDVVGPASSVDGNFASWDGTGGNTLKDSGSKASDFANKSTLTTKGDLYVRDATGVTRLPVGSDGEVLIADSSQAEGVVWSPPGDLWSPPGDYGFMPIGVPIPVWDHLAGVNAPPTNQSYRYVKLTAGEDGVGEYNEGILINELVSGSAPMIEATAEISLIDSPLYGETIHLINTEQSFLRAGGTSGILQFDQMRKHSHRFGVEAGAPSDSTAKLIIGGRNSSITNAATSGTSRYVSDGYQNFSSVSGGTDQTKFMGDETRAKNVSVTYYMRIK